MLASNYLFTVTCRGNTIIYVYEDTLTICTKKEEETVSIANIQSFSFSEPKGFQGIGSFKFQTARSATTSIHWGFGVSESYGAEKVFYYDKIDIDAAKKLHDYVGGYSQRQAAHVSDSSASVSAVSPADELRKYKALLDDGIITEEEFSAKKKQLLGL